VGEQVDDAGEQLFRELVTARGAALVRTAYLLLGDRAKAEDLVQTALIKTYLAWPRIRDPSAIEGYVRRTMATTAVSWWRGRRYREEPVARLPDRMVPDGVDDRLERDALWQRLRALSARQRTVLVLRYYEDLTESEIAAMLGVSRGAVKGYASRALAVLRQQLRDDHKERNGVGTR
jgi:RNA polymerase sigma-70 factor (ECF subfamily)